MNWERYIADEATRGALASLVPPASAFAFDSSPRAPESFALELSADAAEGALSRAESKEGSGGDGISSSSSPFLRSCDNACAVAASAVTLLQRLDERHQEVSSRATALHSSCRAMAAKAETLQATAKKIGICVAAFDSYYIVGVCLGHKFDPIEATQVTPALEAAAASLVAGHSNLHHVRIPVSPQTLERIKRSSPDSVGECVSSEEARLTPSTHSAEFATALDRLDECITFLAAHPAFKDATTFLPKFRQLQLHAFQQIRDAVADSVRRSCAGGAHVLNGHMPDPEATELQLLHLTFRTELRHLRPLLLLIEKRAQRRVYADIIRDCYQSYAEQRATLITAVLQHKLTQLLGRLAPPAPSSVASPANPASSPAVGDGAGVAIPTPRLHRTPSHPTIVSVGEATGAALTDIVRSACAVLARVLSAEHALFHGIFTAAIADNGDTRTSPPASPLASTAADRGQGYTMPTHVRSVADSVLSRLQDDLSATLVDFLRPVVVQVSSIDILCELIAVIRDEVITEIAAPRGPQLAPLVRACAASVKDMQERLVFLANSYIGEYIESHRHFPSVLEFPLGIPISLADGSRASITSITVGHGGKGGVTGPRPAPHDYPAWLLAYYLRLRSAASGELPTKPPPIYDSWYPTLEGTLMLLSKLYRALEQPSFDTLAQDAVAACSTVLVEARTAIASAWLSEAPEDCYSHARLTLVASEPGQPLRPGALVRGLLAASTVVPLSRTPGVATAALDADLFLIKSLLILREQLSPFEVQLTSMARTLDFASTTEALATLLSRAGQVFSLTRDNPLLSFVVAGLPKVSERRVDCKQELESLLKRSCEAFIGRVADLLIEPIATMDKPGGGGAPLPVAASQLTAFSEHVYRSLPAVRRRIGLYLGSAVTAAILFKPIRERLLAFFSAVRRSLAEAHPASSHASQHFTSCQDMLSYLCRFVEATDQLIVDPTNISFGYDDAILPVPPVVHVGEDTSGSGSGSGSGGVGVGGGVGNHPHDAATFVHATGADLSAAPSSPGQGQTEGDDVTI